MRVVVTGANGYIGTHVIEELNKHEIFSVLAVDIANTNLPANQEFLPMDLLIEAEDETLYDRFGKPDVCLHLAWRNGFNHNAASHMLDFSAHFSFLKNLIDHGTKHLAVAGSFREYGSVNGMVDQTRIIEPSNLYSLAKTMLKRSLEIYISDKETVLQWLRPFTVYGDDEKNNSIMGKIIRWEKEGKETFPFTEGQEEYDYIEVHELARQIVATINQTSVNGVIDLCSGKSTRICEMIEQFLLDSGFKIRPEYGAFPSRNYDSTRIYGDARKIKEIMNACELYK